MKVLMLCEGMDVGGCETHVYELILALKEFRNEVTLVCEGGRFAELLENAGVRIIRLPTKRRDPLSLFRTAFALRRLAREGFDIVHAHTRGMALLARRVIPLPLCVTAHLNFHTNRLLRRLCYFGEATLAVSEDIKEYLVREYRVDPTQITITHNGVDLSYFDKCTNTRGIVHLSRLDRDRSLCALLLCRVAPIVLRAQSGIFIHIFGDGNDFMRVKKAAEEANRALGYEGVILHGATTDLRHALSHGDIFVGVSRAAIEAMASHHATVVAGNDGYGGVLNKQRLPSLLKSNFCARGLPKADGRKLAIDLCYLLGHEQARQCCASFCHEIAKRYYAREDMARDALSAYQMARHRYQGRATFIGYYGYGNFGDTMTLRVLSSALPYHKIFVPYATQEKKIPTSEHENRISYTNRHFGVLGAVLRSKEVIFGGGTLFQNRTSTRSLVYYSLIAMIAHAMGRRVRLIGGGVDRIEGVFSRAIAKKALLCFDSLSVRTQRDRTNLAELIEDGRITHLPDPVFLHAPKKARMLPYAAIILNAKADHHGLSELLASLRRVGLTPLFVVLFPREDEAESLRLAEQHGICTATKKDDEEIFSLLAHATLTISERLHGAIASLLVHRPCFLRTLSDKAIGLSEDVEQVARALGESSPLFAFEEYMQICEASLIRAKKEAAANNCGFDKIIGFFKECWQERLMPLLRELPQQQRQRSSPWEPSS